MLVAVLLEETSSTLLNMGKLHEQIIEFKILLKKFLKYTETGIHISCKTKKVLDEFRADVELVKQEFSCKNSSVLPKIRLFKNIVFDKINWNTLFDMYNATLDESESHLEIKVSNTSNNNNSIQALLGSPAIASLIQQILPIVQETLKDKDTTSINPNELIAALTSGNFKNNSMGIDLSSVVEKTTELVNQKIASKELNL